MPHTAAIVTAAMKAPFRSSHTKNDCSAVLQQDSCDRSSGACRAFRFLARHRSSSTAPTSPTKSIAADDRSVTSELTVESCSVLTGKLSPLPSDVEDECSQRKRVRFDLKSNISYDNHVMPAEDCHDLWNTNEEQQGFRASVMMIVKTIVRADTGVTGLTYSAVIQNVYRACQGIDFEIDTSILTRKEERAIKDMFKTKTGQPYVGLERRICRSISKDKHLRRQGLAKAIHDAQAFACGLTMSDAAAEALSVECQKWSLCSRLFARHLAVAQSMSMADDPYYWSED